MLHLNMEVEGIQMEVHCRVRSEDEARPGEEDSTCDQKHAQIWAHITYMTTHMKTHMHMHTHMHTQMHMHIHMHTNTCTVSTNTLQHMYR